MDWKCFLLYGVLIGLLGCGVLKKTVVPVEGNITIKEAYTTTRVPGDKARKTRYNLSFIFDELSGDIQMDSVMYNNEMFVLSQKNNQASAKIKKLQYGSKDKVVSATLYYSKNSRVYFYKVVRIENLEPLYMP